MSQMYIYHIPGKKIGVTKNLVKRVEITQGYKPGEYEVLGVSDDINWISAQERILQKKYGYKQDFNSYATLMGYKDLKKTNMQLNITEQTVTFPVGKDGLAAYLKSIEGYTFNLDNVEVRLDGKVAEWILKNRRVSHFRDSRTYVYNKTLKAFISELVTEHTFRKGVEEANAKVEKFAEQVASGFPTTTFADIREWATERGLYEEGDVKTQYVKLQEEAGELAKALLKADQPEIVDAIGDIAVVLTNLAHLAGHNIEDCIDAAYEEIKNRNGEMINGTFVKSK